MEVYEALRTAAIGTGLQVHPAPGRAGVHLRGRTIEAHVIAVTHGYRIVVRRRTDAAYETSP